MCQGWNGPSLTFIGSPIAGAWADQASQPQPASLQSRVQPTGDVVRNQMAAALRS